MTSRGRVMVRATLALLAMAAGTWAVVSAQGRGATPAVGKSIRYCNPLPIEASSRDGSPQGVHLGDATVVREGDKYYLFGTGGGGWVSEAPTTCRFVRLTMTDWPRNAGAPLGILEFTVFGKAVSPPGPPDPNAKLRPGP